MKDPVDIDRVRAFWNARPCNIRHSAQPVGTKEYFDEVEQRKYFVEPHIPPFAGFPRWSGKQVLEIGCGIGTDTINFARAGARVTAIDLSDESLAIAKTRANVYDLADRITFLQGNAEELTSFVPVEPYDLVYSFGVLHHTPSPANALAQVRSYMTGRSELRLMLYAKISIKNLLIALGRVSCEAQEGVPVARTYTRKQLTKLLAGFDVRRARKDHIFPWRLSDYIQRRYRKAWIWRAMPAWLFRRLESRLGWHWLVTARLAR